MRIEHRRNTKDKKVLLAEKFYPYNMKPRLEFVGQVTSPGDLSQKEHFHGVAEVLLIENGELNIVVENKKFRAGAQEIVIFNAGVKHYEFSDTPSDNLSLFYIGIKFTNPEMTNNAILPDNYHCNYKTKDLFQRLLSYCRIILEESKSNQEFHFEIAQNTVKTFLLYLYRVVNRENDNEFLTMQKKPVREICDYINHHYLENITLDALAKSFYINKYYMSHLFTEQTGMTIMQYTTKKRIEQAKNLLKSTNLPVSEIYEQCGFTDVNYFCRLFKKETDKTPTQYRFSVL